MFELILWYARINFMYMSNFTATTVLCAQTNMASRRTRSSHSIGHCSNDTQVPLVFFSFVLPIFPEKKYFSNKESFFLSFPVSCICLCDNSSLCFIALTASKSIEQTHANELINKGDLLICGHYQRINFDKVNSGQASTLPKLITLVY